MDNSPSITDLLDDNNRKTANINSNDLISSTSNDIGDVNYAPRENGQNHDKVKLYSKLYID